MTKFFIALPLVVDAKEDQEHCYLHHLPMSPKELLLQMIRETNVLKNERCQLFYDKKKLKEIVDEAMTGQEARKRPSIKQLVAKLNDWEEIEGRYPAIAFNTSTLNEGILCACINSHQYGDVLVFIPNTIKENEVAKYVAILPCQAPELYRWLVHNRANKRNLDPRYKKHTQNVKTGKKGVISAATYPFDEAEALLQWAGAASPTTNRYYYHDVKKERLLEFWAEDHEETLFHYFDVEDNDTVENQKIWKEGGRDLMNKIEAIALIDRS